MMLIAPLKGNTVTLSAKTKNPPMFCYIMESDISAQIHFVSKLEISRPKKNPAKAGLSEATLNQIKRFASCDVQRNPSDPALPTSWRRFLAQALLKYS